jgi:hypothetical protein
MDKIERVKKWRQENKDKCNAYNKKWMDKNKESRTQYNKEYYKHNKEKKKHYHLPITINEFYKMLDNQDGKCWICGKLSSESKKSFSVDHNHITGEVRGLLCNSCNLGLGCFKDNIEFLEKAINYLKHSNPIKAKYVIN